MDAVLHPVRIEQALDLRSQREAIKTDVECDTLRTPVESVEMLIEKEQRAFVQPEPFPHTVPDNEASVEDGYVGLLARDECTIQVNQRARVTRIDGEILTSRHGQGSLRRRIREDNKRSAAGAHHCPVNMREMLKESLRTHNRESDAKQERAILWR